MQEKMSVLLHLRRRPLLCCRVLGRSTCRDAGRRRLHLASLLQAAVEQQGRGGLLCRRRVPGLHSRDQHDLVAERRQAVCAAPSAPGQRAPSMHPWTLDGLRLRHSCTPVTSTA